MRKKKETFDLPMVALLRGINVGGKNKLSMKDLMGIFAQIGCVDIRTYIQSGNVVFRSPGIIPESLPESISRRILKTCGLKVPVIVRRADEMVKISKENPFLKKGTAQESLHVGFLAVIPPADRIALLDPLRSPPDRYQIKGKEIYLLFPNGAARTKLTNQYFDSHLGTITTIRNWNTVMQLTEMTSSP